jgi:hypothetical protein
LLTRRRGTLEIVTISALDIFASALGAFMLLTVLMMPYWLNQPSLERARAGAEAERAAAGRSLEEAQRQAEVLRAQAAAAEKGLGEAQAERARAAAELDAARDRAARTPIQAAAESRQHPLERQPGAIRIQDLDLVFVVDTTRSMRPALAGVQASLLGVVRVLARLTASLRIGVVAYRDQGDAYLTRPVQLLPVTPENVGWLLGFVRDLGADGGGDDPEAIDAGLEVALAMDWRGNAAGRIVVIGDNPVHAARIGQVMQQAASFRNSAAGGRFPRTVSAIYTGEDPRIADFFGRLAEAGGGDFTQYQGQMIESILLSVLDSGGLGR